MAIVNQSRILLCRPDENDEGPPIGKLPGWRRHALEFDQDGLKGWSYRPAHTPQGVYVLVIRVARIPASEYVLYWIYAPQDDADPDTAGNAVLKQFWAALNRDGVIWTRWAGPTALKNDTSAESVLAKAAWPEQWTKIISGPTEANPTAPIVRNPNQRLVLEL